MQTGVVEHGKIASHSTRHRTLSTRKQRLNATLRLVGQQLNDYIWHPAGKKPLQITT